jgi:N-acetylglutamate synthase-like GNAT family acetyltransferase
MTATNFRVRRATLDDITQLTALWKSMQFPAEDLSKRITEFQIGESTEGTLLGAVGLQVAGKQGRIHSEGFTDFAFADQLRPVLWERLRSVANNHGLTRFWSQEEAPFWNHCGLAKADSEALAKMPALWKTIPGDWLTLKLRDDLEALISADQEFAAFMAAEKLRTQRTFTHAKILKVVATLIAVFLLGLVALGAFIVLKKNPGAFHR